VSYPAASPPETGCLSASLRAGLMQATNTAGDVEQEALGEVSAYAESRTHEVVPPVLAQTSAPVDY
jgi:hypothetical protein